MRQAAATVAAVVGTGVRAAAAVATEDRAVATVVGKVSLRNGIRRRQQLTLFTGGYGGQQGGDGGYGGQQGGGGW